VADARQTLVAMLRSPVVLRLGIALGCLWVTTCFVYRGFPYERLGQRLALTLESRSGVALAYASVGPRLSLAGPGVELVGVRLVARDGTRLALDTLRVRPAWSLSWLRLTPALHLDARGPLGRAVGVASLGDAPAFGGWLRDVDLAQLPVSKLWAGAAASGSMEARVELQRAQDAVQGRVRFTAHEGNVGIPGLSMALPFETLTGALELGAGHALEVKELEASSPLFAASARGRIGPGDSPREAPIDLELRIDVQPGLRPALESAGLRLERDGSATFRVEGTAAAPRLR
jgi:type II secretion system protein N